ncbi:hypothetical protein C0992_005205 [Termitomyces sp. T32_za158]|nr:hypothetical protein C0992_005205 [Termitomyces sp. T32_za158]
MPFNFVFQGPLLLNNTTQPPHNTSNNSDSGLALLDTNDNSGDNSILPTIKEVDDPPTDGAMVLSQHSPHLRSLHPLQKVQTRLLQFGSFNPHGLFKPEAQKQGLRQQVIPDPRLCLQNNRLLKQLHDEQVRVDILTTQLCQMRPKRAENAWRARGIFDAMSSQLHAAPRARDSDMEESIEVAQALNVTSPTEEHIPSQLSLSIIEQSHAKPSSIQVEVPQTFQNQLLAEQDNILQRLEQSLMNESRLQQSLGEHEQRSLQELQECLEQERRSLSTQIEAATQWRLEEIERNYEQLHQSELCCMQEEREHQAAESTRNREELMEQIHSLKRVQAQESQEHVQRFQQELEEQLQLQHQDLSAQAAEAQQQLEQHHCMAEEYRWELGESTRAREEMKNRIRELEQVQVQTTEQAHVSAKAAQPDWSL